MRDLCNKPVVSEFPRMTTLPPIDRSGLIATRRDLHQHPELGFEERRTSGLVAERLQRLGYTVRTGVGKTGVVGLRDGASGGKARCVLIRADMDALPVEEANDVPYRSQHAGKMHACGHDGHVAIGLEVARRLHAAFLPGSVKLAFQDRKSTRLNSSHVSISYAVFC